MNALQETILDRLMAAERIGALWTPGPLRLACEAVQGAGLAEGDTPDQALGYPTLFCRALEGASGVLARVDDVRTLAITVFSEVPPRPGPPELSWRRQGEVAVWSAGQVRLFHEPLPGPVRAVEEVLRAYLAAETVSAERLDVLSQEVYLAIGRVRLKDGADFNPGRLALSAYYFALHAVRQVQVNIDPGENAGRACRDAARLAALTHGLKGAVPFCLALAQTLDM